MTRRERLKKQVEFLAEELGTGLDLSTWNPGDSKGTRYQVITSQYSIDPGRELFGTWKVFNIREIEAAVMAARETLDFYKRHRNSSARLEDLVSDAAKAEDHFTADELEEQM